MSPLGLYVPGTSPVHRAPAGAKLVGLVALGVLSVWLDARSRQTSAIAGTASS